MNHSDFPPSGRAGLTPGGRNFNLGVMPSLRKPIQPGKTPEKPSGHSGIRGSGGRTPSRDINERITACRACPRLIEHCERTAREKKRAHREEIYWGRPVPSFGDPRARLLIVGLAPAAHGANRTGRMFTGDSSGDWLYEALHRYGFATQPTSKTLGDGLRLEDAWISAVNHCAPPDNKPTPEEQARCRPFLVEELGSLRNLSVVLVLGRIAFDGVLRAMADRGHEIPRPRPQFRHGAELRPFGTSGPTLLCSYHPSRQNTNTGKLTRAMFYGPISRAREILDRT